jgi:hypothetical protein
VRLALEVGEEPGALLGCEPLLLLQDLDVRLQARERRAELVRRVGDEAPLRLDRLLECRKHGVERRAEARELVVTSCFRNPLARVTRLRDPLRRLGQPPHRYERGA